MSNKLRISEIFNQVFIDINKRVAGIDMKNIKPIIFDNKYSNSLIVTTYGDYELTIILFIEINIVQAILKYMSNGKILDDEEKELYIKEYFNIICGHVITIINNSIKKSVRFNVPHIINGIYEYNQSEENIYLDELYYISSYGVAKVLTIIDSNLDY